MHRFTHLEHSPVKTRQQTKQQRQEDQPRTRRQNASKQPDKVLLTKQIDDEVSKQKLLLDQTIQRNFPTITYHVQESPWKVKQKEVPRAQQGTRFDEAKQAEIHNIKQNQVIIPILQKDLEPDTQLIGCRFVCTNKRIDNESSPGYFEIPKARLVAKGFQEDVTEEAIDAPTATKESTRLIAFLAVQKRWKIASYDVKTAFLQSDVRTAQDKQIALIPPEEANEGPGIAWLLRKSLYGLRSAQASFWKSLTKELIKQNFTQSRQDPALFYHEQNGERTGAMAIHVDDFFVGGNEVFLAKIEQLQDRFKFGSRRIGKFTHCGIEYEQFEDYTINIHQNTYIDTPKPISLNTKTDPEQQLGPLEHHRFRSLIGGLMWVVCATRPDRIADVTMLANHLCHPQQQHAIRANKILRAIRGQQEGIFYPRIEGKVQILTYGDAAWANLPNGGSQGGHFILIAPDDCLKSTNNLINTAMISWRSARIKRVVTSTFIGELLEQSETFDRGFWIARMFTEVTGQEPSLDMLTDCKSVVDNSRSLKITITSNKHKTDMFALREALERNEIRTLSHISRQDMIADGLTKDAYNLKQVIIQAMKGSIRIPQINA